MFAGFFMFKLHLKSKIFFKNIVTTGAICLSNFEALCYNILVILYIYISRTIFLDFVRKKNNLAKTKDKRHLGELCHLAHYLQYFQKLV